MKPVPENDRPAEERDENAAIDRVIRWCGWTFVLSTIGLGAIAWYAVHTGKVMAYLNIAGVIYVAMSIFFLTVIAVVFVRGHLGTSQEIEEPKLELFEMDKRK